MTLPAKFPAAGVVYDAEKGGGTSGDGEGAWPGTCPLCGQPAPPVKRLVLLDDRHTAYVDGAPVRLEPKCHVLLEALHDVHPRVARTDYLIARLWPGETEPEWPESGIKIQVLRLRRKLKRTALEVVTERAVGYRLKWTEER